MIVGMVSVVIVRLFVISLIGCIWLCSFFDSRLLSDRFSVNGNSVSFVCCVFMLKCLCRYRFSMNSSLK